MEGQGINRGEVYRGMGKYEKVMFLNFSEARLWKKPVDDSLWSNSNRRELQRLPLPTDWLSTCFSLNPSILDRNTVKRTVNCGINSIREDSQEILRLCAFVYVHLHACLMVVCVCCAHVCVHE